MKKAEVNKLKVKLAALDAGDPFTVQEGAVMRTLIVDQDDAARSLLRAQIVTRLKELGEAV